MLHYTLYRNFLTEGENDYRAVPQSPKSKKIEDIIRQITKPGSILKETECVAVIHDFFGAISENMREGYGFVSEYIRIQPHISGVFKGIDDKFDSQRHHMQISVNATGILKNAIEGVKLEKVTANNRKPEISSVYDLKSQQMDGPLSPGHMMELRGSLLKVNVELEDEGIFLINSTDNSEAKLLQIHSNQPSTLSAMLPENLSTGAYTVEVRARLNGSNNLSTGVFSGELSVN